MSNRIEVIKIGKGITTSWVEFILRPVDSFRMPKLGEHAGPGRANVRASSVAMGFADSKDRLGDHSCHRHAGHSALESDGVEY